MSPSIYQRLIYLFILYKPKLSGLFVLNLKKKVLTILSILILLELQTILAEPHRNEWQGLMSQLRTQLVISRHRIYFTLASVSVIDTSVRRVGCTSRWCPSRDPLLILGTRKGGKIHGIRTPSSFLMSFDPSWSRLGIWHSESVVVSSFR